MNEWSLLLIEALEEDPGYYIAQCFGEGEQNLAVTLTLYKETGKPAVIVRSDVRTTPFESSERGISPGRLRAIPYGQLTAMAEPFLNDLIGSSYTVSAPTEPDVLSERFDFEALRKEWPKGDLSKVSAAVAEVYLSAIGLGTPPKEAVADAFKTSTATAGRMIAKARELGILNVSSVGGRPKAKGTDHGEESTKRWRTGRIVHKKGEQQTLKVSRSRKGRVR